jgi:hypothetical protein
MLSNITDCAVCADGYTSSTGYQCTKCKGTTDSVTIAMIGIVTAVLAMVCIYIVNDLLTLDTIQYDTSPFKRSLHTVVKSAKQLPWRKLRIPIVVTQLLTQFVSITGAQYPPLYGEYLKWLNVTNLDTSWLLSAGCVMHMTFYAKLLITTIAPLAVSAVIGATYMRVRHVCKHNAMTAQTVALKRATVKHLSVFLTFTFLIYSTVSTVVFQTFACDYLEDTKVSLLRADYSVSCDTDKHTAYKVYAAVMIGVYPIGIPLLYAVLLWRHRHSLHPTTITTGAARSMDSATISTNATVTAADTQQQQQQQQQQDNRHEDVSLTPIKFLWEPYRQRTYWWEVVECIRRLLLTGFLVFILPGTAGQSAVACVFAGLSLGVFGLVQPYAEASNSNDFG